MSSNHRRLAVEFDEKKIDAIFAQLDQSHLPGAAVGIAIDGMPVYRKGFGLASIELPVVLSPTIRMRIGSTSKHFTCFAYMLLCEEGRCGIDDPLGRHLPEVHPVARKLTMRQIMGHTSGIRDACDLAVQFIGCGIGHRMVSATELLSLYGEVDDLNAVPGTTWMYNNGAYVLLALAIERITGESFEDVMAKRVFSPLGMLSSMIRRRDYRMVSNSASTHSKTAEGYYVRVEPCGGIEFTGADGVVSTVDDMLRWLANMTQPTLGSSETWRLMKAPQSLANGTSTGYGLGLVSGRYRGVDVIHHAGGGLGGNAQMLKVPGAGLDIIVIVNSVDHNARLLVNRVIDACIPELEPISKPIECSATGVFRSTTTGKILELAFTDGQQRILMEAYEAPAEVTENGVLRPLGVGGALKYSAQLIGDPVRPTSVRTKVFGDEDEYQRINGSEHSSKSRLIGQYHWAATDFGIAIEDTSDGLTLTTSSQFGPAGKFSLEHIADSTWRARALGVGLPEMMILTFEADSSMVRLSNGLTQSLPFRRSVESRSSASS